MADGVGFPFTSAPASGGIRDLGSSNFDMTLATATTDESRTSVHQSNWARRWATFIGLGLGDLVGRTSPVVGRSEHCQAATDWLKRAQDATPDGGVSYGYSLRGGWRPSYRETTGYIAETFFDLATRFGDDDCLQRAIRMVDWLVEVQNPDGSFSNPDYGQDRGIVFDTGQDLFGLVRAFEQTGDECYLASAERAGSWLVEVADDSGRWTRNTHLGVPHVYNSRAAWALLRLHDVSPKAEREAVARANLDWAVSQESGGWFEQCAFEPGVPPFTHTIAYAIRGLLESSRLIEGAAYEEVAIRSADAVLGHVRDDGFIPGRIDVGGRARGRFCCLTGNCQLSIIWGQLYESTGDSRYRTAALRALGYVLARQNLTSADRNVRGAILGSHPIWGRYSPLTLPNWPTKFLIDALLTCMRWPE